MLIARCWQLTISPLSASVHSLGVLPWWQSFFFVEKWLLFNFSTLLKRIKRSNGLWQNKLLFFFHFEYRCRKKLENKKFLDIFTFLFLLKILFLLLLFCVVHSIHPSIHPISVTTYPALWVAGELQPIPSCVRTTCYAQHAILNYLGCHSSEDKMLQTLKVSANKAGKSRHAQLQIQVK